MKVCMTVAHVPCVASLFPWEGVAGKLLKGEEDQVWFILFASPGLGDTRIWTRFSSGSKTPFSLFSTFVFFKLHFTVYVCAHACLCVCVLCHGVPC